MVYWLPLGGLNRPSIPQFILDTNHPWINENEHSLEELGAEDVLCNPHPSLDRMPDDLFKRLSIDNTHSESVLDRASSWLNADSRLREIRRCKAALDTCQSLHVHISQHRGPIGSDMRSLICEPPLPPPHLPSLFADVLDSMPRLEKLECIKLCSWARGIKAFEAAFLDRNLTLPSVESLILGPDMHFLIPLCPNLRSLDASRGSPWYPRMLSEGRERHDLIRAARNAPKLEEFGMSMRWNADDLEEILENMPRLKKLRLHGRLSRKKDCHCWNCCVGEPLSDQKIKNLTSVLARFTDLESLRLPPIPGTGLTQQSPHDGMIGPSSLRATQIRRRVTRTAIWKIEQVGSIIGGQVPGLKSLMIGNISSVCVHRGFVVWPWTGRLREFMLAAWPRYVPGAHLEEEEQGEEHDAPLFGEGVSERAVLDARWTPGWCRRGAGWGLLHEPTEFPGVEFRQI
ncbi:hypothetical protein ACJZ2D_003058 [Fusarium nematophilum]